MKLNLLKLAARSNRIVNNIEKRALGFLNIAALPANLQTLNTAMHNYNVGVYDSSVPEEEITEYYNPRLGRQLPYGSQQNSINGIAAELGYGAGRHRVLDNIYDAIRGSTFTWNKILSPTIEAGLNNKPLKLPIRSEHMNPRGKAIINYVYTSAKNYAGKKQQEIEKNQAKAIVSPPHNTPATTSVNPPPKNPVKPNNNTSNIDYASMLAGAGIGGGVGLGLGYLLNPSKKYKLLTALGGGLAGSILGGLAGSSGK